MREAGVGGMACCLYPAFLSFFSHTPGGGAGSSLSLPLPEARLHSFDCVPRDVQDHGSTPTH